MKNHEDLYNNHIDYEFIAKKNIIDCKYAALFKEVEYSIKNLKIGEENGK